MKIGALILGIIGSLYALLLGSFGYAVGGAMSYFDPNAQVGGFDGGMIKFFSVTLPIVGLVGGGIVYASPLLAGVLLLGSDVGILITIGLNSATFIPAILMGIGGFLAISAHRAANQATNRNDDGGSQERIN
jgi:hypothetical protein